jgi:RHS repeat-associated protein
MTTAAICATREVSWRPSFYRGEQYDSDLGLYYLRARYYNPATGRFVSMDPENGIPTDPKTLHKYLYAGGDPVNAKDPTGRADVMETGLLEAALFTAAVATYYAARSNPTAVVGALHELGETLSCSFHRMACMLTSLADKNGSVWGSSRCLECYESCVSNDGIWPSRAARTNGSVRCDYWNYK